MLGRTVVVPSAGSLSSAALSLPRTQSMIAERSVALAAPSIEDVIAVFDASKRSLDASDNVVPGAHAMHVNTRRGDWSDSYLMRSCSATAPFSTTSPSGLSLALGGVPFGSFAQNVLSSVQ